VSLYDALGVSREASTEEITDSYRRLARECHPDVDDSQEAAARFHELSTAFRTLSDPARRRDYDTFLEVEGDIPMSAGRAGSATGPVVRGPAETRVEPEPEVVADPEPRTRNRVQRHAHRRRVRMIATWVAVAVAIVAGASWLALSRGGGSEAVEEPSPSPIGGRSDLALFSVGSDPPFAAIVGTGGDRAAVVAAVPYNLLTPPGAGGGTIGQAFSESGATGRSVVANVSGTWVPVYAQINMRALSDIVAGRGGITLDLGRAVDLGKKMVGPGPTRLSGPQVAAYLEGATGNERNLRWEEVLQELFAGQIPLPQDAETNDATSVEEALTAAEGADVTELPTQVAEGPYRKVDAALMEQGMADLFGIRGGRRTAVSVFLGVDRPGLSERVTEALVPKGFQIAGYQDTKGLDKGRVSENTTIYYYGEDLADEARRVQEALGVGNVVLSELDSGVANIDVTVGKDYAASLEG
jgi:hypothetical protein